MLFIFLLYCIFVLYNILNIYLYNLYVQITYNFLQMEFTWSQSFFLVIFKTLKKEETRSPGTLWKLNKDKHDKGSSASAMSSTFVFISFFDNHLPCPLFQLANKPQGLQKQSSENTAVMVIWTPNNRHGNKKKPQLQVQLTQKTTA